MEKHRWSVRLKVALRNGLYSTLAPSDIALITFVVTAISEYSAITLAGRKALAKNMKFVGVDDVRRLPR